MLSIIDRFLALSPDERTNFRIGRRARIYTSLDELSDTQKHGAVERIINELNRDNDDLGDNYQLMGRLMGGYFSTL
jgi:hypothetical protein